MQKNAWPGGEGGKLPITSSWVQACDRLLLIDLTRDLHVISNDVINRPNFENYFVEIMTSLSRDLVLVGQKRKKYIKVQTLT